MEDGIHLKNNEEEGKTTNIIMKYIKKVIDKLENYERRQGKLCLMKSAEKIKNNNNNVNMKSKYEVNALKNLKLY